MMQHPAPGNSIQIYNTVFYFAEIITFFLGRHSKTALIDLGHYIVSNGEVKPGKKNDANAVWQQAILETLDSQSVRDTKF